MKLYHPLTLVIITSLVLPSITDVYAELSYERQVKFVTAIEEVMGHILAAKENIEVGNQELAKLHLTHPIAELYDDLHNELKNNSEIDQKVELVLFILKNTNTDVSGENFDSQSVEILKILDEAKTTLIQKEMLHDDIFKSYVIIDLLEMSKMEYVLGVESGSGLIGIVEFQDSHAFVVRADRMFNSINLVNEDKKDELLVDLLQAQLNISNQKSQEKVIPQLDTIIEKISLIIKNELEFESSSVVEEELPVYVPQNNLDDDISTHSDIPSWIKLNAAWWADDLISDEEFISGIEYLIEENVIVVSLIYEPTTNSEMSKIPDWIKNRTGWWADGIVSDAEFISGIEYLIKKGILHV